MHLESQAPLHVCHFIEHLKETETCQQILENMASQPEANVEHTLIVIHESKGNRISLPANAKYLELNIKKIFSIKSILECQRALKALKPDICQTYGDEAILLHWLSLYESVVLRIHSLPSEPSISLLSHWKRYLYFLISRKNIHYFTVASRLDALWLIKSMKIKTEQIKLVQLPINTQDQCPPLRKIERYQTIYLQEKETLLSLANNKFLIGISVNNMEKDNALFFFNAFIEVTQNASILPEHLVLVVLGNAPYLPELRRHFEKKMISSTVCYIGFLNDYFSILTRLDTFVHLEPTEKPARLLLEAMSMALPIVSYRTQIPTEKSFHPINWSLKNKKYGIKEQLISLFQNQNKRLLLGRSSREYVKTYHCIHMYHQTIKRLYFIKEHTSLSESSLKKNPKNNNREQ